MIGVIVVMLAEAHEWAEAHWVTNVAAPVPTPDARCRTSTCPRSPSMCPAYNEPPEMLIETLDALAALDYPDFEVLVIDNNTKDPAVWQPVEAHCRELGPRFRFFHVDPLTGFKAGALNFALRQTAPDAEIVAVIDSDYMVEPRLAAGPGAAVRRTRASAIVQAPQDYRDDDENVFKAMCNAEYRGFFHIGMVTRNERNAIIQHGTMTMVRRSVLERSAAGPSGASPRMPNWACGSSSRAMRRTTCRESYGQGLMPDTFLDYKKQRFRWAYGAMQIMRHHCGAVAARRADTG